MEEIKQVIGFKATDGKIFDTQEECVKYEQQLVNSKIVTDNYKKLKKTIIDLPMASYHNECTIMLIELKNKQDYDTLVSYYDIANGSFSTNYLKEYEVRNFPCVKAIYDCDSYTDFCYYRNNTKGDTAELTKELIRAITDITNFVTK